jgi:trigger factor
MLQTHSLDLTCLAAQEGDGSTLTALLEQKDEQIPHEVIASENLPGSQVRYKVRIPADILKARTEKVINEYKREVSIPGFRKGKAPVEIVRSRFQKPAADEAMRKMTPRIAQLVAKEKSHEVFGDPMYEGWEGSIGDDATLTIILEVRPEITITEEALQNLEATVIAEVIDDARVDRELENLRKENATFEPVGADYACQVDDGVVVNAYVYDTEGNRLFRFCEDQTYMQNPSKQLPPDVAAGLAGHKVGEDFTIENVTIRQQDGSDLKCAFRIRLHEIKKRVLPQLDDEFAKDISTKFQSLADLRADVVKHLEDNREQAHRAQILSRVYELLSERISFDIPTALIRRFADNSISKTEQRLNQYGLTLRSLERDVVSQFLQKAQQDARRDAKNMLLADQLGRFLEMSVTDEEVEAEIARIAEAQGRKPLAIRAQLEARKQLEGLRSDLRIKKVNDKLISVAKITEVQPGSAEAAKIEEAVEAMEVDVEGEES